MVTIKKYPTLSTHIDVFTDVKDFLEGLGWVTNKYTTTTVDGVTMTDELHMQCPTPTGDSDVVCFGAKYKDPDTYDLVVYSSYDDTQDFYSQPNTVQAETSSTKKVFTLYFTEVSQLNNKTLVLRGSETTFSFLFLLEGGSTLLADRKYGGPYNWERAYNMRMSFHIGVTKKSHPFSGGQFCFVSDDGLYYLYEGVWFSPNDNLNSSTYKVKLNMDQDGAYANRLMDNNITNLSLATFWVNRAAVDPNDSNDYSYIFCGTMYDGYVMANDANVVFPFVIKSENNEAYFGVSIARIDQSSAGEWWYAPLLTREPQYDTL